MVSSASISSSPESPRSPDPRDRTRAALRLVFDAARTDDLARATVGYDENSLEKLVNEGRRAFNRELWIRRLRNRGGSNHHDRALAPGTGADADEALSLALHLGLNLDAITLSDAFDRDAEEIGEAMYRARRVVDPTIPPGCARFHEALGRYDDRTLDADDRLKLLAHVQSCSRCADVLDRFRELDSELRAEVAQHRSELPLLGAASTSRGRRTARSLATIGVGLVLVVVLLGAVLLLNRLTAAPHEPVPVVTSSRTDDSGLSGWMVQMSREGALEIHNMETGERRLLFDDETMLWTWPSFSPTNSRVAIQGTPGPSGTSVVVRTIQGERLGEITWDESEEYRWISGWLDDDTLLFVKSGPIAMDRALPPADENSERLLLAVDVASGEETLIHRGSFQWANPSPDGSMVALLTSYEQYLAGHSIELRSMSRDGLGPVLASIEGRALTPGEWSRDSERLFVSEIADEEIPILPTPDPYGAQRSEREWEQTRLVSFDRQGNREVIVEGGAGQWGQYALGASGHDGSVIYATYETPAEELEPGMAPVERVTFWQSTGSGAPELLGQIETIGGISRPLWSPDGEVLLVTASQPFYLDDSRTKDTVMHDATRSAMALSYTLTPDTGLEPAGVALSESMQKIAWLSEDVFPSEHPSTEPTFAEQISAPEPVSDLPEELRVSNRTAMSSDHRFLVLEDSERELPVFWDRTEAQSRRLDSGLGDVSWLSDGPTAIVAAPVSRQDPSSRLTLFGELTGYDAYSYGNQRWDPANIGDDRSRRYMVPIVSGDGGRASFFVVDDDGTTELWIAGWEQDPRRIASWDAPNDAIVIIPPVAAWIGNTLLFTEPTDWDNGLPRKVALSRVRWEDDGDPVVEQLTELDGRGSDRGVALVDLLPSPDGDEVVYRMRHYSERTADRGRRDTIHVMSIRDATRSVEIARGTPGEGIDWSPDGEWIVANLERRVVLLSPDGTTIDYLTGKDDTTHYPIWVSHDEIWFAMDGHERAIWRVFVR